MKRAFLLDDILLALQRAERACARRRVASRCLAVAVVGSVWLLIGPFDGTDWLRLCFGAGVLLLGLESEISQRREQALERATREFEGYCFSLGQEPYRSLLRVLDRRAESDINAKRLAARVGRPARTPRSSAGRSSRPAPHSSRSMTARVTSHNGRSRGWAAPTEGRRQMQQGSPPLLSFSPREASVESRPFVSSHGVAFLTFGDESARDTTSRRGEAGAKSTRKQALSLTASERTASSRPFRRRMYRAGRSQSRGRRPFRRAGRRA